MEYTRKLEQCNEALRELSRTGAAPLDPPVAAAPLVVDGPGATAATAAATAAAAQPLVSFGGLYGAWPVW